MYRKLLILILIIWGCGQGIIAEEITPKGQKLTGHIFEKETKDAIPYATILVVGTNDGTVSNDEGIFEMNNLSAGKHKLRISAVGYQTIIQEINIQKGTTPHFDFSMEEENFEVDEVVVSASRNEVSRREAPVIVNVISNKLFETVNSPDLAKSLNYQSGLRVENSCQNCGFPQVRINGLDGPYSQILINSRPIISALSGVYGLEQIPVNMIERIEVVRGGGSALFGANAVGGTINIITKDPINNSFQVSSTVTNYNGKAWDEYMGANASLVGKDNSYGLAIYQSMRNRNPYDHDNDGFSEIGLMRLHNFGLRGYYRPNEYGRFNIEYHTTNEKRRGGNKFDSEPHEADIAEQTHHIINSGGIGYDQFWNEYKHKLSVYASMQHTARNSYYGMQQDPNAYGRTNDLTWVTGATYVGEYNRCLFSPATFTAGLEYQGNALRDKMLGYGRDMHQEVHIESAFLQNEWKMSFMNILIGGRLDKHNMVKNPIFSPRINLLFKPLTDLQVRLTYSTGFRAPQAFDEDLHVEAVGGEGVQIKMAKDLSEEKSQSVSGSIDYTAHFGHWQANVLVEGFYTGLRDVFVLDDVLDDAGKILYKERRNGQGARVYGANLDAKIAHGKDVSLQLGFTAQQSRYTKPEAWTEVNGEELTTTRLMRTPDYYGYFTLTSQAVRNLDLSLSGIYTGKMWIPHYAGYISESKMERTRDFMELNAKVGYTFNLRDHLKVQLNTGVQNILNTFQPDLDKGTFRDAGYFYGPTQPRTYFVGLKFMN